MIDVASAEVTVVTTTVGHESDAVALAERVVEERLAACAKRRAVASIYRWRGAVQRDEEVVVEMVTVSSRAEALVRHVREHRPYELPEVLVVAAPATAEYAEWVELETRID